ncbi:MAG: FtsL-like putative cell division protein [Muribaculaceae bacterium]|nr:FtsL-like putative cell division protein [Muribaculaceae bacterium]
MAEKSKIKQKRGWMSELRYGRSLSIDFLKSNAWLMLRFVVAILALIGLRYKTKTKMAEIKQLTVELQRAESHKLQEKSLYMSLIRESEMVKMVREKNLNLEFQEQPPFELTDDETK